MVVSGNDHSGQCNLSICLLASLVFLSSVRQDYGSFNGYFEHGLSSSTPPRDLPSVRKELELKAEFRPGLVRPLRSVSRARKQLAVPERLGALPGECQDEHVQVSSRDIDAM